MTGPDADEPTRGGDPRRPTADVDSALLDDPDAFEAAVEGGSGPLAVVGSPFSGREAVLDAASDRLDATRVRLEPGAGVDAVRAALDDGPVVVEGCHHLHARRIGGFEPVERFLCALGRADVTVVTGWNRHAWTYLSAVVDVDREFPARVDVEPATAAELADRLLDSRDGGHPTFVREDPDAGSVLTVRRVPVEWRGHTVSVPVPNRPVSPRRAQTRDRDPKEAVFERLAAVSNGNRGVAAAIWERHGRGSDEVRPGDLVAAGVDADLTHEDAFCLRVVLSKEVVDREELREVVGERTDRVLGRLAHAGLVAVDSGGVSLEPAGVPTAVAETDRRGIP